MSHRLTVVVSQSRSQNPKKRTLEEQLVAELLGRPGVDVTVVPHLYELKADGTGMLCLTGIGGDLVVCSWLYPRAARWVLDRNGIRGREGVSLLKSLGENDEDDDEADEDKLRVIDRLDLPARRIYCLDLRAYDTASVYLEEIGRIAQELKTPIVELTGWSNGNPKPEQMERYLSENGNGKAETGSTPAAAPTVIDEDPTRPLLFGAPGAEKAMEVAAHERDEQLLLAGREVVAMEVGMPKRHAATDSENKPKDDLDRLVDSLDELDL